VIYGIDILKSLFSRLPGFEMTQDKKFQQYMAENESSSEPENVAILDIGKACWELLACHETVRKRTWNPEMIHKNLLDDLDDIFEDLISGKLNTIMLSANSNWDELMADYEGDAQGIFKKYVTKVTWADTEQQDIRDQMTRKLEWILIGHKYHYAVALPIMTKSTIVAIGDIFKQNHSAISEVSDLFYWNLFVCSCNICTNLSVINWHSVF
jgi:hypothetical protein